jgi:tripartite-type tricarboxylate transporter receptor subunit TctC
VPATRLLARIFPACLVLLAAASAHGQNFPNKTIRIVTTEPGSTSDFLARLLAQGIAAGLGRQVIVENKGGGMLASDTVLRAAPDGSTIILNGSSLWLAHLMRDDVPYDPVKDFLPITLAASAPSVLVVHPAVPARSIAELIALAKARPGELNYGSGSTGAPSHLAMELFKSMAGVSIARIPYKGTSPAINALLGGQVQMMVVPPTAVLGHIKSGRLRGLAVTSPRPSELAPGLPPVSAEGLPGFEVMGPFGLLAPARTPAALINRLNQEMVQVVNRPDERQRLFNVGVESIGSSPEEFAAAIGADILKWSQLIKAAGIREE